MGQGKKKFCRGVFLWCRDANGDDLVSPEKNVVPEKFKALSYLGRQIHIHSFVCCIERVSKRKTSKSIKH